MIWLEVLKEILTRKEKTDLLQEVEEFEERKNQEDEFEWWKGKSSFHLVSVSCGFTFRFINFFKSIMAKFAAMLVEGGVRAVRIPQYRTW